MRPNKSIDTDVLSAGFARLLSAGHLPMRRQASGMTAVPTRTPLPSQLIWLLVLYAVASLVHFSHNAEYIALYPNMPAWLTREKVYVAWLAISAVGLVSGTMWLVGWRVSAFLGIALYGLLGLDGLAHYTLALCSEHTLATNFTIWLEALAGLALAASSLWHLAGRGPNLRRCADA